MSLPLSQLAINATKSTGGKSGIWDWQSTMWRHSTLYLMGLNHWPKVSQDSQSYGRDRSRVAFSPESNFFTEKIPIPKNENREAEHFRGKNCREIKL